MASLLTLSDIIALPQGTKAQIDAKVRALLSNNMIQKDPQGDPALRAMDEEEFCINRLGWFYGFISKYHEKENVTGFRKINSGSK